VVTRRKGSPEGLRYIVLASVVILVAQPFRAAVIAQTAVPTERVTFDEAIQRAVTNNPSAAIAAAGILRAEALLLEARSATRLQVNGNLTTTTLNRGVEFDGQTVTPQSQLAATLDVRYPLYAPARWAQRAQADAARNVAQASADDVRRQTALATADAYLMIIARRRVVEGVIRARESARAHFDLARQLQERGTGSRLNELRAQQELSLDEGLVEAAQFLVNRLAVLLVSLAAIHFVNVFVFWRIRVHRERRDLPTPVTATGVIPPAPTDTEW